MALTRYEREKESTIGQGNCAFNAFTLALCDSAVFGLIERAIADEHEKMDDRFSQFIYMAAQALRVDAKWLAVKSELLRLREHDKSELQNSIAPIMRQLSIDIAEYSHDAVFLKSLTVAQLVSAYSDYQRKQQGKEVFNSDDVFCRHQFINDKFYQVYWQRNKSKLQRKKEIENWWWADGYDLFLEAMRHDGVWAGDIELARLAKYFNVVLEVIPDEGFLYNIYGSYGFFPYLDDVIGKDIPAQSRAEIIDVLKSRFVISNEHEHVHPYGIDFTMSALFSITKRLEKIPNYEQVRNFVTQRANLKGEVVPPTWPRSCIEEMIQRNIIGRHKNGKDYIFSLQRDDVLVRINEIPYREVISNICRQYFKSLPNLVLHKSPDHWSNTLKIISPEERERQKKMREQMERLRPNFFSQALMFQAPELKIGLRKSADSVVGRKT